MNTSAFGMQPRREQQRPIRPPDHRRAVLGIMAAAAGCGVSVSTLSKSWYSPDKLLPLKDGYPAGLTDDGLSAILAGAEADGLLVREAYKNGERKARTWWALTAAGVALVADAHVAGVASAHGARAMERPAEETSAPVAQVPQQRIDAQPATRPSALSPIMVGIEDLATAITASGIEPTPPVLASRGCAP
jgi:hypothetical protein